MALITGTGDLPTNIQGYFDRNLLERAVPALVHSRFGQSRPVPRNQGTRINFSRLGSLPAATTPITEGVTPSGNKLVSTTIYATIQTYGDFVTISDMVIYMGLISALAEASDVLGEQMGLTIDTITRAALVSGTQVRYAGGVDGRTDVATAIAASDVKSAQRILESANSKKITTMIEPGAKISTRPVPPAFYCITHTDCRQDWEALPGFVKVETYASQQNVQEEEIGAWGNIRVITTSNAYVIPDSGDDVAGTGLVSTSGSKVDVYTSVVLAANAYGIVPLQKGSFANIVKKLGEGDDPLNQRATSGWKAFYAARILNDSFMVRIEHGVTALS